jgi:hypothetical protein
MTHKWNDKPIKTQYIGLVSIELFNIANRNAVYIEEGIGGNITVHYDYSPYHVKRMKDNPLFPHKKVILCPSCKKPFLGSSPKSKNGKGVPTYHCGRNHKYFGVNKIDFDKELKKFILTLKKEPDFINAFKMSALNKFKEKEKELGQVAVKVSTTISELESDKQSNISNFITTKNETIRTELEKRINALEQKIVEARTVRNEMEVEEQDIHIFAANAQKLMEHPVEMLMDQDNPAILLSLFGLVFEELPTYEEIVNGTPKMSLLYNASDAFKAGESANVRDTGIEPVTSAMSMLRSNHMS